MLNLDVQEKLYPPPHQPNLCTTPSTLFQPQIWFFILYMFAMHANLILGGKNVVQYLSDWNVMLLWVFLWFFLFFFMDQNQVDDIVRFQNKSKLSTATALSIFQIENSKRYIKSSKCQKHIQIPVSLPVKKSSQPQNGAYYENVKVLNSFNLTSEIKRSSQIMQE